MLVHCAGKTGNPIEIDQPKGVMAIFPGGLAGRFDHQRHMALPFRVGPIIPLVDSMVGQYEHP